MRVVSCHRQKMAEDSAPRSPRGSPAELARPGLRLRRARQPSARSLRHQRTGSVADDLGGDDRGQERGGPLELGSATAAPACGRDPRAYICDRFFPTEQPGRGMGLGLFLPRLCSSRSAVACTRVGRRCRSRRRGTLPTDVGVTASRPGNDRVNRSPPGWYPSQSIIHLAQSRLSDRR